jgi:2Fe-2S ferredoxin
MVFMQIVKVIVQDMEGVEHSLDGLSGWRLMEVIRDYGLPIKAECGGACSCATCHIYVEPEDLARLQPMSFEEIERLDEAFEVKPNSRLSCQIILDDSMQGLKVQLAAGSEP